MARSDGRADDELREISIKRGFQQHPAGSVLVSFGQTTVLCAASVTEAPRCSIRKVGSQTISAIHCRA